MMKILVLGASLLQIPLILKAKELGYFVIVVDRDENAPGKEHADAFYPISTNDTIKLLALAKQHSISGIVTNSDYPVRTASMIAQELGLPGMSPISATIATNKFLLREILSENGIACPRFAKIQSNEDLRYHAGQIGFPSILKPVDSSASRGVTRLDSLEGIEVIVRDSLEMSRSKVLILEEYISGKEYSVESITWNGKTTIIAITAKTTTGAPHFVETGHIVPAQLEAHIQLQLENLVQKAIKCIGVTNAATHTELKINESGIWIIEIGPRLGGDYITTDLVPLSTGYDMVGNTIRLVMGVSLAEASSHKRHAGISYYLAPPGKLIDVRETETIHDSPEIVRYEIFARKGETIRPVRSSQDRAGYVIAVADSREQLLTALNKLKASVSFHVK